MFVSLSYSRPKKRSLLEIERKREREIERPADKSIAHRMSIHESENDDSGLKTTLK